MIASFGPEFPRGWIPLLFIICITQPLDWEQGSLRPLLPSGEFPQRQTISFGRQDELGRTHECVDLPDTGAAPSMSMSGQEGPGQRAGPCLGRAIYSRERFPLLAKPLPVLPRLLSGGRGGGSLPERAGPWYLLLLQLPLALPHDVAFFQQLLLGFLKLLLALEEGRPGGE